MTNSTRRRCRVVGCGGHASERSGLCRPHVLRRRYYGSAETLAPNRAVRGRHLREAARLLQQYSNRVATTEALKLAARVPDYIPSHDLTLYLKAAFELDRLGARASAEEILTRAVAAHLGIESPFYEWPDRRAEHQYLGRVVLGELWHRDANGRRYLLTGRVVSEIGEHVSGLLGSYCRKLIRTAASDAASTRAAVERSCNFEEMTNA